MLINEVEHIVGLSKKSIRYYEEIGLLSPKRGKENDYRLYSEEEIKKLKIIKFLRELDVPIQDLKQLKEKNKTLQECMKDRMKKITELEENLTKVKKMCKEIEKSTDTYETIDITKYFQEMNRLNKEGFTMKSLRTDNAKKIEGAVLSSIVFGGLFLVIIGIITYLQLTKVEKLPWIIYFLILLVLLLPLVAIIINLISRIKEIKRGEEDEASKY